MLDMLDDFPILLSGVYGEETMSGEIIRGVDICRTPMKGTEEGGDYAMEN